MTLDELRALATATRNGFTCWPAPYQMSPTLEDCEFLHALVRVTKPRRVLEFGTGKGVSARFIAEALATNANGGLLLTREQDRSFWPAAEELLLDTPAAITAIDSFSPADELVEVVFIDSGPQYRAKDIEEWLGNGYTGLVVVHDANRQYAGLAKGAGVFLPGSDGLWLGRAAG